MTHADPHHGHHHLAGKGESVRSIISGAASGSGNDWPTAGAAATGAAAAGG